MSGVDKRRGAALVTAALVVSICLPAAPARAAPSLSWSAPTLIDRQAPYGVPVEVESVSCPSATLCAATDFAGDVVTSTNPMGGADAWQLVPIAGNHSLLSVSCPTASLCVAGDDSGDVLTST